MWKPNNFEIFIKFFTVKQQQQRRGWRENIYGISREILLTKSKWVVGDEEEEEGGRTIKAEDKVDLIRIQLSFIRKEAKQTPRKWRARAQNLFSPGRAILSRLALDKKKTHREN
jgi:hypothetical protein